MDQEDGPAFNSLQVSIYCTKTQNATEISTFALFLIATMKHRIVQSLWVVKFLLVLA